MVDGDGGGEGGEDAQDAVAGGEAGDAGADFQDGAGAFAADGGVVVGVHSQGDEYVAEVHPGRADRHPYLALREFLTGEGSGGQVARGQHTRTPHPHHPVLRLTGPRSTIWHGHDQFPVQPHDARHERHSAPERQLRLPARQYGVDRDIDRRPVVHVRQEHPAGVLRLHRADQPPHARAGRLAHLVGAVGPDRSGGHHHQAAVGAVLAREPVADPGHGRHHTMALRVRAVLPGTGVRHPQHRHTGPRGACGRIGPVGGAAVPRAPRSASSSGRTTRPGARRPPRRSPDRPGPRRACPGR